MIFALQKVSLLDYPGNVACTVFLGGCNFRCPYCHNSELLDMGRKPSMDTEELLRFLNRRRTVLNGVAITGGEPLLWDLAGLLSEIKRMEFLVKLDTNGTQPERLAELLRTDLVDYVAMDIKHAPDRYQEAAGLSAVDIDAIRESATLLLDGVAPHYEFRTTVVSELHDHNAFREIGAWIRGAKRYYLQPFVDRDTVPVSGLHAPSSETMREYAEIVRPFVKSVSIRGM